MLMTGLRTLRDLIEEQADRRPESEAWVLEDMQGGVQSLSYGEVDELTSKVAAGLQAMGVGFGDKVGLRLTNRVEFLLAWFALGKIGAVGVPTITTITQSETLYVVTRADISVVITDPQFAGIYEAIRPEAPTLREVIVVGEPLETFVPWSTLLEHGTQFTRPDVSYTDVHQMMFTSGSTSAPKCVMITHSNVMNAGERLARGLGLRSDDRNLSPLPFFHANCQGNAVLSSFTAGATAVILERFSVSKYWSQVRRHDATIGTLALPGAMLSNEPSELDRDHRMRWAFAGTPLPRERQSEFEERFGVTLVSGYGLTEAMVDVSMMPLYAPREIKAVGLPMPGRDVRILDDDGVEVANGEKGEIVVAGTPGVTVMSGYFKDPVATAEALHDGYLFTGDLGHFDEKGYLYFDGRKKDIIKRAGENVAALEVEEALVAHPDVIEAAVFGMPDEILGEAVYAVVVLRDSGTVDEEALKAHSLTILTPFKVPQSIEIRTELPRSAIGKILKPQLREEYAARFAEVQVSR